MPKFGRALLGATVAAVVGIALTTRAAGATPLVQAAPDASYGEILETSAGLPLYTLATDHDGTSTCTGGCLQAWPPLAVPTGVTPTAAAGVPGQLAVSVQADGTRQVTYDGAPLYTFAGDRPGIVTGQGVSGFSVVQLAMSAPTTNASGTATSPGASSTGAPSTAAPSTAAPSTAAPSTGASSTGAPPPGASSTAAPSTGAPTTPGPAATAGGTEGPAAGSSRPTGPAALAFTGAGDLLRTIGLLGALSAATGAVVALVVSGRRRDAPTRAPGTGPAIASPSPLARPGRP